MTLYSPIYGTPGYYHSIFVIPPLSWYMDIFAILSLFLTKWQSTSMFCPCVEYWVAVNVMKNLLRLADGTPSILLYVYNHMNAHAPSAITLHCLWIW